MTNRSRDAVAAAGAICVDVWLLSADSWTPVVDTYLPLLDERERRELVKLVRASARTRYIASHGFRRSVLAGYLQDHPRSLRFDHGPNGKPYLLQTNGGPDLHFNASHTEGLIAIAVCAGAPVGIDVEYVRDLHDLSGLAGITLSPRERAQIAALSDEQRLRWFLDRWVAKESILKATGDGLSVEPSLLDIHIDPNRTAHIVDSRVPSIDPERCALHMLSLPPRYTGALTAKLPASRRLLVRLTHLICDDCVTSAG